MSGLCRRVEIRAEPFEILRGGSDAPLRAFLRSRRADLLHDNDSELDALRRAYTAKFDELCALLAAQYGEDPEKAQPCV